MRLDPAALDMDVMFTDTGTAMEEYGDNVVPMQRAAGANEVTPGRATGSGLES